MTALRLWSSLPASGVAAEKKRASVRCGSLKVFAGGGGGGGEFPSFLPKEVQKIQDPFARTLAQRIQRLPVEIGSSESSIMSSCVKPLKQSKKTNPVVLLHCFDSSCLEWRCTYPLLEEAGLEAWAVDVLGWGFSDLEMRPPCDVASKRYHLYQLWKSYIKRPMILVGPSLGASVAVDFTVHYPEAVEKLVFINPSVYAEGTGNLAMLPKPIAYAGVSFLKSLPLRIYANSLAFNGIPFSTILDWTNASSFLSFFIPHNSVSKFAFDEIFSFFSHGIRFLAVEMRVGRLHCLLPWWDDATVSFMVKHETLIICGEQDRIVSYKLAVKLHSELQNAIIRLVPETGHLPHVDKPNSVAKLIVDFTRRNIGRRDVVDVKSMPSFS
ncbi:hypothetical protein Tsubulata_015176, partial [Turnera subulata]